MIDSEKKSLMRSIINAFETDTKETDYSTIYIYHDGPDRRRQVTLGFGITEYGNLAALINDYIQSGGIYSDSFKPYANLVGRTALVDNDNFKQLLKLASKKDQAFRDAEDRIYDHMYWDKAFEWYDNNHFTLPLSMMVILDSFVHSGTIFDFLRSRFAEMVPVRGGDEQRWIDSYVKARREWLLHHSNRILRNTVYRMDFLGAQIFHDNWLLQCPLIPHGVSVC